MLRTLLAALTAVLILPATAEAAFPGANGRIAYTKAWQVHGTPGPDARSDIFSVRPNGSGNKRLTFSGDSTHPMWSPSGGRIAFERDGAVWVMQADGSQQEQLTDGELVGWMPAFGRILVVRGLHDGAPGVDPTWVIYRISTGVAEEHPIDLPLFANLEEPYDDDHWSYAADPALSADGKLLALTLRREDYGDDGYTWEFGSVFTVRLDGTELTKVGSKYSYGFGSLDWSTAGDELVYQVEEPRASCYDSLRSITLDGSEGSVTISKPCAESDPDWSPDGKKIVFTSASGRLQIAPLDGAPIKTVLSTKSGVYRYDPDWRRVR
jgi:hypothetical protein